MIECGQSDVSLFVRLDHSDTYQYHCSSWYLNLDNEHSLIISVIQHINVDVLIATDQEKQRTFRHEYFDCYEVRLEDRFIIDLIVCLDSLFCLLWSPSAPFTAIRRIVPRPAQLLTFHQVWRFDNTNRSVHSWCLGINAVLLDVKEQQIQAELIPSFNQTSFNESQPLSKPFLCFSKNVFWSALMTLDTTADVHGYYEWLNFLKSSTSTESSNTSFVLKTV